MYSSSLEDALTLDVQPRDGSHDNSVITSKKFSFVNQIEL